MASFHEIIIQSQLCLEVRGITKNVDVLLFTNLCQLPTRLLASALKQKV